MKEFDDGSLAPSLLLLIIFLIVSAFAELAKEVDVDRLGGGCDFTHGGARRAA